MKRLTLSIGIPAYNEQANIKNLLIYLLKQKLNRVKLKEIIVASDGSTDDTVERAKSINDPRIKIIHRSIRIGAKKTQNEILKLVVSDILVMLDADILPLGNDFINQITEPLLNDLKVGIVGADTISAKPRSFLESIIADSHELKKDFYKKLNKGDNLYLCHGRARAFSKKLYSKINWPDECSEDAYSYLFNKSKGFKFIFAPSTKVLFRSPSIFSDHEKQSSRFLNGRENLKKFFSSEVVEKEFYIPWIFKARSVAKFLLRRPITTLGYLLIFFYIKVFSSKKYSDQAKWEIALSSKKLVYENN